MADHANIADLKKCVKDCNGDEACVSGCEAAFVAAGGTASPDGKVFTDPNGGKVFVTPDGKVF
jgi:hypothetical protein